MANEAVIIELMGQPKGRPVRGTVADAVGIEKGALLFWVDPRTLSGASAIGKSFGGIASTEKVASDGSVSLGAWTCGIFDLTNAAAGTITVGDRVTLSGTNLIAKATVADVEAGRDFGTALETASADEVIAVAVGIY